MVGIQKKRQLSYFGGSRMFRSYRMNVYVIGGERKCERGVMPD